MLELQILGLRRCARQALAADGFASDRELALAKGVVAALDERERLLLAVKVARTHLDSGRGGGGLTDREMCETLGETLDVVDPDRE